MTTSTPTRQRTEASSGTRMIEVLHPVAEAQPDPVPLAERPARLQGLRIGFLDNSKANADVLLRRIEARLREQIPFEAVHARKPNAAMPAPDAAMRDLLATCQVVVNAVGD